MRICLIFTFLLLFTFSCKEKKIDLLETGLQQELIQITQNKQVPGASLAVVLSNDKVLALVSGFSDVEKAEKMTPQHLLFSGSVGKTYVMALVLKMVEEGLLNPEDKVSSFFKEEDWFNQIPNHETLTIRMLLNHTSGIPRYVFKSELWKIVKTDPDKTWTGKERLSLVFGDPPVHPAGKGWAYSDTNYIILGMIIEKLKGKAYYEVLQEEILIPLQLDRTFPSDRRNLPGLASGYTRLQFQDQFGFPAKVTENETYCMNPQLEWTGGGINFTATDLARWGKLLYSGKVLSGKYTDLAMTPTPFETGFPDGAQYGFGTIIWEDDGIKSYGHTGFMFGYVAIVQYVPQYDIALALLINTDDLPPGAGLFSYLNGFKTILFETLKQKQGAKP